MNRILLVMVLGLSGCAPAQWVKQGGTPEGFEQAKQECIYDAQLHVHNVLEMPLVMNQCLRVKGWVSQ